MLMKRYFRIALLLLIFPVLFTLLLLSSSHSAKSISETATSIALDYEGIRESGDNKGETVEMFIRRGGGKAGWSWCMYFVYFAFDSAASKLEMRNPLQKTGSCARQLLYANSYGNNLKVIKTSKVFGVNKIDGNYGDILIFKHGTPAKTDIGRLWNGHTGILLTQNGDEMHSIEGNTNIKGSREGDGVYRKIRNPFSRNLPLVAIIRVVN